MSARRVLTIVLVVSAVLLTVGIGPRFARTARALPGRLYDISVRLQQISLADSRYKCPDLEWDV